MRRQLKLRALVPVALSLALTSLFAPPSADAAKCANGTNCPANQRDANGCCKAAAPAPKPTASPTPPPTVTAKPPAPPPPPPAVKVGAPPAALTDIPTGSKCPSGMAQIPGGSFKLGDTGTDATVAGYCLDLTEVTVDAYAACVTANGCTAPNAYVNKSGGWDQFYNWKNPAGRGDHPINAVGWNQATAYCGWARKRLPSEAEWEWAARNGDRGDKYPWGAAKPDGTQANACGSECVANAKTKGFSGWSTMYSADDGFGETAPVGSFPKGDNRWGVHDLSGNVWEWTSSKYDATDPVRVNRGGCWYSFDAAWLSASLGYYVDPSTRDADLGFRCARSVP